jgi:hypothetical protein
MCLYSTSTPHYQAQAEVEFFPHNLRIDGFPWTIHICRNGDLKIGCERRLIGEWDSMSEREVLELGGKRGLALWRKYKTTILAFARGHQEIASSK